MFRIHRHLVAGLPALVLPASAELTNVEMDWAGAATYGSFASHDYPDTPDGGVVSFPDSDFYFRDDASKTWRINDGATIILKQDGASAGQRFFLGIADGGSAGSTGTLTITSDSGSPGTLSARGNAYAAMRIGHESGGNSASGVVNIDGGVTMQTGWVFGEGTGTRSLNILDGEFHVFSDNPGKRLNEIDITLGLSGALWIEDSAGSVTDLASFLSFVSGATLTASAGTLTFTNSVVRTSADTLANVAGTLIAIDTTTDTDGDGLPDSWELFHSLDPNDDGTIDPVNGAAGNPDHDGSPNLEEFQRGTDPRDADSDNDNLPDGVETDTGTYVSPTDTGSDPLRPDTDGDGFDDGTEVNLYLSDPTDSGDPGPDMDRDGLPNDWEIANGLDPLDDGSANPDNGPSGDPDNDGLPNSEELALGSDPQVNESAHPWLPRPAKARLMVINAHPDDEAIFFGGVLPYYTQVRQLPTVCVCMTSGDYENPPPVREGEFRNAAWVYGLRYQPHFPRFKDYPTLTLDETWDVWADGLLDGNGVAEGRVLAGNTLATYLRRYRPEVVVTHDFNGEYGHKNHQATAEATADAISIAADPGTALDGLPVWQVKKLYVHLYDDGPGPSVRLFHDFWEITSIDTDGNSTPDMTPRQVADLGLDEHLSQVIPDDLSVSSVYRTGEPFDTYHCEWWGLHSSTVGNDAVAADFTIAGALYSGWARGDFFANLPAFPDTDADELPDAWELTYFPTLAAADPAADGDGDGYNALYEFVAGLDPGTADTVNFLISQSTGKVHFTLPAAAGPGYTRGYEVQHSADLATWTSVLSGSANGTEVTYTIPSGAPAAYYRLAVSIE